MLSKTVYSLLNSDCEILKRFGILLKRKLSPVDDHELNDLLKLARNNYDPDIFGEINSRLESVITRTLTVERNFFGDPENSILSGRGLTIRALLRAVRTQAILFMKSMSERVGSDIERLGVKMKPSSIDCESNLKFNFRILLCRIRLFPTLISKIKWLGSGLPLMCVNFAS